MKTERSFYCLRERYHYDFEKCRKSEGFIQWDCSQDAHYFGIWVNPEKRQILTYAEGDETLETCESEAEYHKHLQDMAEAYGDPPPAVIAIDSKGQITHYFDERPK